MTDQNLAQPPRKNPREFPSVVTGFSDGALKGLLIWVWELFVCFYPAEISWEEVDLILPGLQLSNPYQNVFLCYII